MARVVICAIIVFSDQQFSLINRFLILRFQGSYSVCYAAKLVFHQPTAWFPVIISGVVGGSRCRQGPYREVGTALRSASAFWRENLISSQRARAVPAPPSGLNTCPYLIQIQGLRSSLVWNVSLSGPPSSILILLFRCELILRCIR